MSRQTSFPGIIVEKIKASAGGSGRTLEFTEGLPEKVSIERIKSFIESFSIFGDPPFDSVLTYQLRIVASTKGVAKAKSKMFARAKNPFTPSTIRVSSVRRIPDAQGKLGRDVYRVNVEVVK